MKIIIKCKPNFENDEHLEEYKILAGLNNCHMVQLVSNSFYENEKYYCFVMEYCQVYINLINKKFNIYIFYTIIRKA